LEADSITLYTNCPGGDVFAAEAMCQALREHPAKVTMQIEGYAASAATAIACACDEVIATAASKYMIHQTWTLAIGNADELLQTVDLLRKCDDSMYDAYERRTGQSRDQIIEWCKAETWFTAEEAVKFGFVDSVLTASSPSASAGRRWNLSAYANAPAPAQEPARAQEPAPLIALATEDHRVRQQQRIAMLARLQVS
jgi:ATP-dependent Clp protease protease subunit